MLNRDVKQFGKHFLLDGQDETCWNSDQVSQTALCCVYSSIQLLYIYTIFDCVCAFVYVCIYMCVCMRVCVCGVCMLVCVCVCVHACVCVCVCVIIPCLPLNFTCLWCLILKCDTTLLFPGMSTIHPCGV